MPVAAFSARFERAIAEIDGLNAADPRRDRVDDVDHPREIVYAERLSRCLASLYPDASELLCLAARAQHVCRWQIARQDYPQGRDGYQAWRLACREHHVALTTAVMQRCGYADPEIAHVAKIIRKQELKRDPDSQALENAVAVTFAAHYLSDFVASHGDYDDAKLQGILRKTMRKLDDKGRDAIKALSVSPAIARLVAASLSAPQ